MLRRSTHCPLQRIAAFWPVIISHSTEGRRQSWPWCLVAYQGASPVQRRSPIPVLTGPNIEQLCWCANAVTAMPSCHHMASAISSAEWSRCRPPSSLSCGQLLTPWSIVCHLHTCYRAVNRVAPSRIVGVSASVNPPLHRKVQKFSPGTGSPGWSRKRGRKTVVVWWCFYIAAFLHRMHGDLGWSWSGLLLPASSWQIEFPVTFCHCWSEICMW